MCCLISSSIFSSSSQKYGAGSGAQVVSVWIFPKRFLAGSKEIAWRFARRVNGQMPPSPWQYGGQTENGRIGAGIEHQVKCGLFVFMDQTGKLFFLRVGPVGQSHLRVEPTNLGVCVELLFAQHMPGTWLSLNSYTGISSTAVTPRVLR